MSVFLRSLRSDGAPGIDIALSLAGFCGERRAKQDRMAGVGRTVQTAGASMRRPGD